MRIVVIGAGVAGLATALLAARRGNSVTIVERDKPAHQTAARPGVPHARQGHIFLGRSAQILRAETPEVLTGLLARGAREVWPGTVLCRRQVYESELRRIAEAEPGVTIDDGIAVTGLTAEHGKVSGVMTSAAETMPADVVVNASGRRSAGRRWLADLGFDAPAAVRQKCGYFYITRHYRLRDGQSFPDLDVPLVTPLSYLTVLAFPADSGHFQLSIAAAIDDPLRHQLRNPVVFDRVVGAVPMTRPWLERGSPLGDPEPMASIENCWQQPPAVAGYVPVGDALLQTNPTMGRGVTFAFMQAQRFAAALDQNFGQWASECLGPWFAAQVSLDEVRHRQLAAGLQGQILPPSNDPAIRLTATLAILAKEDEAVRRASLRLYNMLMTPRDLMADRAVARPIVRFLRAHDVISWQPPEVPDRAAFERMAGA